MTPVNCWITPSRSSGSRRYRSRSNIRPLAPDRKQFSRRTQGHVSPFYCIGPILMQTTPVQKSLPMETTYCLLFSPLTSCTTFAPVLLFHPQCLPCHPSMLAITSPYVPHYRTKLHHDHIIPKKCQKARILSKVMKIMVFVIVSGRLCMHITSNSPPTLQSATQASSHSKPDPLSSV